MAKLVGGSTFIGKTITLGAYIDLSAHYWNSIGTNTNWFSGTFNGVNYTISGMHQDGVSGGGLFACIQDATIKNVRLEATIITSSGGIYSEGTIVSLAYNSTIENCTFTGSLLSNRSNVGGIIGDMTGGSVTNCTNNGVVSGDSKTGGIIGVMSGGSVTNCTNNGAVSGKDIVGGIVGSKSGGSVHRT